MKSKHDTLVSLLRNDLNGVATRILGPDEANRIASNLWFKSGQDIEACMNAILELGGKQPSDKIKSFRRYGLVFLKKLAAQTEAISTTQKAKARHSEITGQTQSADKNLVESQELNNSSEIKKKHIFQRRFTDNPKFIFAGLGIAFLAVLMALLLTSEDFLSEEQRYTFSCESMHGGWGVESILKLKISQPLLGKQTASVEVMTPLNRSRFKSAWVHNFDDDFVYFTDGWGYNNEKGYDMCKVGWQRRCLIAKTIFLKANKKIGENQHRYTESYHLNCCHKGEEKNGRTGIDYGSGSCTRLGN